MQEEARISFPRVQAQGVICKGRGMYPHFLNGGYDEGKKKATHKNNLPYLY